MGVPSFYRWLSKRFPRIVVDAKEEEAENGRVVDTTKPNPNGVEYDNLYLDMNGIIHPCCHPEDKIAPSTEEEMILEVFKYIDRIFAIVRPRKLIYMAIDGVAPRAKMNQQRSRRFRSAKEATENAEREEKLRKDWIKRGFKIQEKRPPAWDSNVITPGTPFMDKLAKALHYYIHKRLQSDPGWRGIKVIFSDAAVPGEGEHKIMHFIRMQRAQKNYDPNTRHCLYGMDADLIMLGLASHDPHFSIIREMVVDKQTDQKCWRCGMTGHIASECTGEIEKMKEEQSKAKNLRPYQFLHINVLREYLERELMVHCRLPFQYDFEKMVDDWVMLCFLVGNDFLPHLPSLSIREGAIVLLSDMLKGLLPFLGGYLTENNEINLTRLAIFLNKLGDKENGILMRRGQRDKARRARNKREDELRKWNKERKKKDPKFTGNLIFSVDTGHRQNHVMKQQGAAAAAAPQPKVEPPSADKNKAAAAALRKRLKRKISAASKDVSVDAEKAGVVVKKEDPDKQPAEQNGISEQAEGGSVTNMKVEGGDDGKNAVVKEEKMDDNNDHAIKKKVVDSGSKDNSSTHEKPQKRARSEDFKANKGKAEFEKKDEKEEIAAQKEPAPPSSLSTVDSSSSSAERLQKTDSELRKDMADWELAKVEFINPETDYRMAVKQKNVKANMIENPKDDIRFGEEGWKERYYKIKMGIDIANKTKDEKYRELLLKYTEGLVWVYRYYYQGCTSWSWFFPFHYSPMASDLGGIDEFEMKFNLDKPFKPLGQLMGVLPSHSAHCLPPKCKELMTSDDSPIKDFYPTDFALDLNGKKYTWQAVALLPWIDEKRLQAQMEKIEATLTEEEKERNKMGFNLVFVHKGHPLANHLCSIYSEFKGRHSHMSNEELLEHKSELDYNQGGLSGFVIPYQDAITPGDESFTKLELPPLKDLPVVSARFEDPVEGKHTSKLLSTLTPPPRILNDMDFVQDRRGNYGGRPRHQNFQTTGLKGMDGNWSRNAYANANMARHLPQMQRAAMQMSGGRGRMGGMQRGGGMMQQQQQQQQRSFGGRGMMHGGRYRHQSNQALFMGGRGRHNRGGAMMSSRGGYGRGGGYGMRGGRRGGYTRGRGGYTAPNHGARGASSLSSRRGSRGGYIAPRGGGGGGGGGGGYGGSMQSRQNFQRDFGASGNSYAALGNLHGTFRGGRRGRNPRSGTRGGYYR